MGQVMEPVFSCCDMCCNARKWWQWLALKRDGFISTKMGTASWGTLLFLHPACCVCISDASFHFFPYENLFSGKNNTCTMEFTMKNIFALLWGAWVLCPGLQSENTNESEGSCQTVHDHLYPDLHLAVIHNSGCECLCLSKAKHSYQFS